MNQDRQLQLEAICLTEIAAPLESFYKKSLDAQGEDPVSWAAQRAWALEGSWWQTCLDILQRCQAAGP